MKNCGQRKVRKHKEIKVSGKCVTLNIYEILNISEKFYNLNKMETTSSETKLDKDVSESECKSDVPTNFITEL